jgi:SAM-dependent methyltransferase
MTQPPYRTYPAPPSDRELERLAMQARDLAAHTAVLFRRAGLSPGHRVLDLGCGNGDVAFIAADIVGPNGYVIGIDHSATAVETARERARRAGHSNVEFQVGDVAELEMPDRFDVIVGRLVLMYLREPIAVVARMRRFLRPHGLIVLQEGDVRTIDSEPECPLVSRVRDLVVEAVAHLGCAANMGSKLGTVLHEAGFRPEGSWTSQPSYVGTGLSRLDWFADLVRSLTPAWERPGAVTSEIVQADTLAARLVAEAGARNAIVFAPRLVGVWARVAGGFIA